MSILDIRNMTTAEKIMAMEELWEDMDKNAQANEYIAPQWHEDILKEREEKVQNKKAVFSNFDEVKKRLQSRLDCQNANYNT
jgi:hypothetical protein